MGPGLSAPLIVAGVLAGQAGLGTLAEPRSRAELSRLLELYLPDTDRVESMPGRDLTARKRTLGSGW